MFILVAFAGSACGETINAASCSQADVQAAIDSASGGDTVNVPAGSCTWSNRLVITKGIKLIGAGDGVTYSNGTVITCTYSSGHIEGSDGYAVVYSPDQSDRVAGFRLSGFEFDFSGLSEGIGIWNELANQWNNPVTNVRVDHNILKDGRQEWMVIGGVVYGVADNNIIDHTTGGGSSDGIDHMGLGDGAWQHMSYEFGTSETWFWEDNTFKSTSGYLGDNWDCTNGARYVARYNTIQETGDAGAMPAFNFHGNTGSVNSCMGMEIYRNSITAGTSNHYITTQRGGKAVAFDNSVSSHASDYISYVADYGASCNGQGCDTLTAYPVSQVSGEPQHPSDSYYWNNEVHGSVSYDYKIYCVLGYSGPGCTGADVCCPSYPPYRNVPQEGLDVWFQHPTFDGTAGVGVGTKAQMDAITTCTEGVGYWVTDEGDWNSESPGPDGQLYRCGSSNNWVLYYTPYTYPHPLREDGTGPVCGASDNNPLDGVVSNEELTDYISSWKSGDVAIGDLIAAIAEWKNGC